MTRFVITGASGLLGLNLSLQISNNDEILGVAHTSQLRELPFELLIMDLVQNDFNKLVLEKYKPDVVIHCAAIANLEECEKNPKLAFQTNAWLPGEIAKNCKNQGIKLVHISTDAVFDGRHGNYNEQDLTNPLSVYANTKLVGETNVLNQNPDAIVARVNFFGWSPNGKRSLAEFFYNNLSTKNSINGFTDVHFCPLYVGYLSEILLKMVELNLSGVYHVVSSDYLTKYQFGCEIADRFGFDPSLIKPISVSQSDLKAERSLNLTLSTQKLSKDLNQRMPTVKEGINRFFKDKLNGYAEKVRSYYSMN